VSLTLPATAGAGAPTCMGRPATRVGTAGDDTLRGTAGADVFLGRAGDDRIVGRGGDDVFCAGPGNDVVKGGAGDDTIVGQGGVDVLVGGPGNDSLFGGASDDRLDGGIGVDDLDGGTGTDDCALGETLANCETGFEFEVDGPWTGTTSQARDITFDVADHALTEMQITYEWTGSGGCALETTVTIVFEDPEPIEDNSFAFGARFFESEVFVEGTFDSETSATGTFSASDSGGTCPGSASGTWSVARE
jgi:hypothetical protein